MAFSSSRTNSRLPPEVNRILFVRNLPFKLPAEEIFDLFGKYGPIRQIRQGNANDTRGTAYIVYEDIFDAAAACQHLSGFNVGGRYLIVLFYQPSKDKKKKNLGDKEEDLNRMKATYGVV